MVHSGIGAGPQAIPPSCCDSSNTRTVAAEDGWHAEIAAPAKWQAGPTGLLSSSRSGHQTFSNTVVIVDLPSVGGITPPVRVAGRI